jgi:hypothetical protein
MSDLSGKLRRIAERNSARKSAARRSSYTTQLHSLGKPCSADSFRRTGARKRWCTAVVDSERSCTRSRSVCRSFPASRRFRRTADTGSAHRSGDCRDRSTFPERRSSDYRSDPGSGRFHCTVDRANGRIAEHRRHSRSPRRSASNASRPGSSRRTVAPGCRRRASADDHRSSVFLSHPRGRYLHSDRCRRTSAPHCPDTQRGCPGRCSREPPPSTRTADRSGKRRRTSASRCSCTEWRCRRSCTLPLRC